MKTHMPSVSYALGETGSALPMMAYGSAHFSKSLFWYGGEILFAYFLTETAGLSALEMGMVLALGLAASAICDLVVGRMLQARLSSTNGAVRLQLTGAIVSAITLLVFLATAYVPASFMLAYGLVSSIAFRAAYAVYDMAQNCLMALATTSSPGRAKVAALRMWCSGLATLLVAGAIAPLVNAQTAGRGANAFLTLGGIACMLAIGSALVLTRVLRGADAMTPFTMPVIARARDGWTALLLLAIITSLFSPIFTKLEPYLAHHVLDTALQGSGIAMSAAVGILLAQPIWARLAGTLELWTALALGALVQGVGVMLFGALLHIDLAVAGIGALLFGAGSGAISMTLWTMLGDAAAGGAPRRKGWMFAQFTATAKLSLAFGGVLVAFILSADDFRSVDSAVIPVAMASGPLASSALILAICALLPNVTRRERSVSAHARSQTTVIQSREVRPG